MSMRTNRRAILLALESTYNDSSTTPVGADALLLRTVSITPLSGNDIERVAIRPYYGNSPQAAGEKHVQLQIEMELAPSGTAGVVPKIGKLLRLCGFSETVSVDDETVTYAPISEQEESGVFYAHIDGNLHKGRGARGTVSFTVNADSLPVAQFTLSALASPVTGANLPQTTLNDWVDALVVNTLNTEQLDVMGHAATFSQFSLDMAVTVVHQKVVGANDVVITGRAPSGSLQIQDPGVAAKNFFEVSQSASTGEINLQHGKTAGEIIEIKMPRCGIASPEYADLEGVQMLSLNFTPTPVNGNDEVAIIFR